MNSVTKVIIGALIGLNAILLYALYQEQQHIAQLEVRVTQIEQDEVFLIKGHFELKDLTEKLVKGFSSLVDSLLRSQGNST